MKKQTVHPLPLTYASYDELYGAWQRMVKTPESGSMYYHNKSDLLYRIHQLRTDSRLKNRYLKETMLHVIDVESENIEDPEGWEDRVYGITRQPAADSGETPPPAAHNSGTRGDLPPSLAEPSPSLSSPSAPTPRAKKNGSKDPVEERRELLLRLDDPSTKASIRDAIVARLTQLEAVH